MRWITIAILTMLLAFSATGCNKKQGESAEDAAAAAREAALKIAKSPAPQDLGQAQLDLEFISAKAGSGNKPVNLTFTLEDTAGNSVMPKLSDPKQPEPGEIAADGWRYVITPRIGKGRESNTKLKKAFIRGYFCCDVYEPQGKKAGHFDVLNTGNMMCKGQTEIPGVTIEPITCGTRTLFLIWGEAAPDGSREVMLGLEWQPARFPGQHEVTASDGWTYSMHYPQGILHAYQPHQLKDWPREFRLLAQAEQDADEAYHDQRLKELSAPPPSCGG